MHKILDVDYTDATELTLDNWLSAAKQMFTILPEWTCQIGRLPIIFRATMGQGGHPPSHPITAQNSTTCTDWIDTG